MTDKTHSQYGLGGIRSECAGGWNATDMYVQREPTKYKTPEMMKGPSDAPTAELKKKTARTTKRQDAAAIAANKNDLKKRNLK